ncbi:MAG: hypothetical protein K6E71_03930 [Lachnospiraceae bacterium]|nr:hypothetical protein [Lachnospiraceae bacterium]
MKREISRLITMLLALLIGIGVCVATASAEDPDEDGKYPLWFGETQVTTENKDKIPVTGGTAKYDPSTCTLTLKDVTGVDGQTESCAILYKGEGKDGVLTIVLEGESVIKAKNACINSDVASITFGGTGALYAQGYAFPGVHSGKNITVPKGVFVAACSYGEHFGGFHAEEDFFSEGNVQAYGGGSGITANRNLVISGGTVFASASDYGLFAGGELSITGDKTIVMSKTNNGVGEVPAISAEHTLTIGTELLVIKPDSYSYGNYTIPETPKTVKTILDNNSKPAKEVVLKGTGVEVYSLWVGGTYVTSLNKDSIPVKGGTASFDPSTTTLTLSNVSNVIGEIWGYGQAVRYDGDNTLKVKLVGENAISKGLTGLSTSRNLVFEGSGSLSVTGADDYQGINSYGDIEIGANCTISATTGRDWPGILAGKDFSSKGKVVAIGGSFGIQADNISITAGSVEATGSWIGLHGNTITLSGEETTVIARYTKEKTDPSDGDRAAVLTHKDNGLTIGSEMNVKKPKPYNTDGKTVYEGDSTTPAKELVIEPVKKYPIWFGETQVTDENKDKISFEEGFAKYIPETNTLILNNISKKNEDADGKKDPTIEDPLFYFNYLGTDGPLNIELVGTNYFDCQSCGFQSAYEGLVFQGTGTLTVNCIIPGSGFIVAEDLVIEEGCTVNVNVLQGDGFQAYSDFICKGTATVTGDDGYAVSGVSCRGKVLITGTFTATEVTVYGIEGIETEGTVEINGGKVSVNGILVEKGALTISNGSDVESNARYHEKVFGSYGPSYGLCAATGITITDSTVTATSDMTDAIHCEDPDYGSAKIIIENSTVVAKSVPKADETKCPGRGIFNKEGTVSMKNSEVTAEGTEGIYTEWGEVIIEGGSVKADGKDAPGSEYADKGCGIYVGYENLELTDGTLTVNGTLNGIFVSMGSYIQRGGELVCKGGIGALRGIGILASTGTQAEPKVTIEAREGANSAVGTWGLYIASGTVSIKGGTYGVIIGSEDPGSDGLEVENTATKVVIEGTKQAILLEHDDVDKKIVLGNEIVIREPEKGKVSDDKRDFLDANGAVAKKVVLVKDCEISFEPDGGTGSMEGSTADSGSDYTLPSCGIKPPKGKGFAGWRIGSSEEIKQPGTEIIVSGSVVIKPVWEKLTYKITQGGDGTWTEGDFEIIVKADPDDSVCFENFLGVYDNGTAWTNGKEYTASKGSTKILIKEDTLKSLAEGKHDLVIALEGAEITTSLTVSPKASEDNNGDTDGGTDGQATDGGNSGTDGGNNGGQATDGGNNGTDGGNNGGNNGGTDGGNGTVESPKTGDSMPNAVLILLALAAFAGIGATVILRRRSERE